MQHTETDCPEHVVVEAELAVFFTNGSITDSATLRALAHPAVANMDTGAAASLWKLPTDHFTNLGNPDCFFADRAASEWVSFTLTTCDHLLLNEIERILTLLPGNA